MATGINPVAATKPRHDLADVAIVLLSSLALAFVALFLSVVSSASKIAGTRDFVAYYATGRQLIQHANPYDPDAIRRIERASGLSQDVVLIMRNPPWALPLAWPLGLAGVRVASLLWSLMLLACLVFSVQLIHKMNGSPPNQIHWLGFCFTPALICLTMGQTALFPLLGVTLFLRYHQTHPFWAGASLWLCTLKPHLLLPFAVTLLVWIVVTRSYQILAGPAVAMAVSCLLTLAIYPAAFTRYTELMRSPSVVLEFVPCLSDVIRFAIDKHAVWLQYLPGALCSIWAVWYYWRRREGWDWLENGSVLLLISLVSAPYLYLYDQAIAIPALIRASYKVRYRNLLLVLIGFFVIIGLQSAKENVSSLGYVWTSPAWLIWYFLASAPGKVRAIGSESAPLPVAAHSEPEADLRIDPVPNELQKK